jgi:hypothetical protein
MNYRIEDFTEQNYKQLIRLAKDRFKFIMYNKQQINMNERCLLWRHDIDFSVHRSLALAKIEADEGVCSTYFIHLSSRYYNVMESDILKRISKIIELGHEIALHFDCDFRRNFANSKTDFEDDLLFQKNIFYNIFNFEPKAFSFHNPTDWDLRVLTASNYAGMVNTYSQEIRESYKYCSDSNGYWRFERLEDVLKSNETIKLQVLTHPEWWTPLPLLPYERIQRAIKGRQKTSLDFYNLSMEKLARVNVKKSSTSK